jgi:hypothetical protein
MADPQRQQMRASKGLTRLTSKVPPSCKHDGKASVHACLIIWIKTLLVRRDPDAVKYGKYSKEELDALDRAIKEYAQEHGLSTTNFE